MADCGRTMHDDEKRMCFQETRGQPLSTGKISEIRFRAMGMRHERRKYGRTYAVFHTISFWDLQPLGSNLSIECYIPKESS